jgi:GNAT superfamily N-acetyltransferase
MNTDPVLRSVFIRVHLWLNSVVEPVRLIADDLAPGDGRGLEVDWGALRVERVRSPEHPLFARLYDRLWAEFGHRGEMEKREVIAQRLGWQPRRPINHHALRYEMLAVLRGDEIVGLRDHTAIVPAPPHRASHPGQVIVHLSHVIVEPPMRGGGLSAWLRAFPLQTARECVAEAGETAIDRITLVAEMEHPDGVTPMVMARLRSYDRAGFLKLDPDSVRYMQPDFRPPAEIDASSVQPVPLALVMRRVGREAEPTLPGAEVRAIVEALYTMFGVHMRADHMAPLWALLDHLPGPGETVLLRRPLE